MQSNKTVQNMSSNNLLIVLLLVSFLVVGTTAVVAKTLISGLIRDTKVLKAENKANDNLDKNKQAAPKLIASYQDLGTNNTRVLADALPNDSNLPGIIVAMENMANQANITLKSVAAAQVAASSTTVAASGSGDGKLPAPQPQPYAFTIAFDGSYASLQQLMADIESYTRPMRVTALKLSGNGTSLSGTIDIETYYQDKAKLPLAKETIK